MTSLLRLLAITPLFVATCLSAAETTPPAEGSKKPSMRGSFETFELPILDLVTLDLGDGYQYQSAQVELSGKKIWVSGVLGLGEVSIGDTVSVMVNKHDIPDKRAGTVRKAVMIQVMPDMRKALKDLEKSAPATSAPAAH